MKKEGSEKLTEKAATLNKNSELCSLEQKETVLTHIAIHKDNGNFSWLLKQKATEH